MKNDTIKITYDVEKPGLDAANKSAKEFLRTLKKLEKKGIMVTVTSTSTFDKKWYEFWK